MPRLRTSYPGEPGIARRRTADGFVYVDHRGRPVADAATLDRIAALAIPPAWDDVWISPYQNGHIQAAGTDAAGRRQYLYHEKWRERRDGEKFDRMLAFAAALPDVRRAAAAHLGGVRAAPDGALAASDLTRERVLACALRLLDLGFFRIGGEAYAEENKTFGLATMRKEHVTLAPPDTVVFSYVAKSHKERVQTVSDAEVYRVVARLKRRRAGGDDLLAWRHDGAWRDVRSQDINEYLKEITGGDYTAKDFRTWHATVLAAVGLAVSTRVRRSPTASRRAIVRVVKEVAHYLGNTPAVARSSYIDPRVIERYLAGRTIAATLDALGGNDVFTDPGARNVAERAVIALIAPRAARHEREAAAA